MEWFGVCKVVEVPVRELFPVEKKIGISIVEGKNVACFIVDEDTLATATTKHFVHVQ